MTADAVVGVAAPGRPARDPDPARNTAYWRRVERLVDAAPPLSDRQRAAIRVAFHQTGDREEQAA